MSPTETSEIQIFRDWVQFGKWVRYSALETLTEREFDEKYAIPLAQEIFHAVEARFPDAPEELAAPPVPPGVMGCRHRAIGPLSIARELRIFDPAADRWILRIDVIAKVKE
jgi:hypothetical protein